MKKSLIILGIVFAMLIVVGGVSYYFLYYDPGHSVTPNQITDGEKIEIRYAEDESNSLLTSLLSEEGIPAEIENVSLHFVGEKALISAKGEIWGINFDAESIEVHFEGTEATVNGNVKTSILSGNMNSKILVTVENEKLKVDVKVLRVGLPVPKPLKTKIENYLNEALKSLNLELPVDELERIKIENGELVVKGIKSSGPTN
jgi:hypothetical protein